MEIKLGKHLTLSDEGGYTEEYRTCFLFNRATNHYSPAIDWTNYIQRVVTQHGAGKNTVRRILDYVKRQNSIDGPKCRGIFEGLLFWDTNEHT